MLTIVPDYTLQAGATPPRYTFCMKMSSNLHLNNLHPQTVSTSDDRKVALFPKCYTHFLTTGSEVDVTQENAHNRRDVHCSLATVSTFVEFASLVFSLLLICLCSSP